MNLSMNAEDAKIPNTEGDWHSIEIFLFSNGQQYSPPRKYHLDADELNWWEATLNQLAQSHYGIQQPQIYLYTIDGHLVEGPLELKDGQAYVAVQPPEEFIDAGYQKYLLKASRSWEKRQAKKKAGCCYEDCTGYPKDVDRFSSGSIEPLMPATKQPDWKSPDGNFVTTVRPKPETGIYYPSDYGGVLSKSGTISHPEPNKVYKSEPYDNKPSKQDSGTDLRRDNDNSSKTSNQSPSLSRPRNTGGVQVTDHNGESDNVEPWTSKVASKPKPDLKGREQSEMEGFHVEPQRILGSMDRGFQQRNYDKTFDDYDSDETSPGSMFTHGTMSFTHKPRSSDNGSKIGQQRARPGDYGSKDGGNVATLSKNRPSFGENGKNEIKLEKNGIESSVNEPMSTELVEQENNPDDQTFLTDAPINTGMGNLGDKKKYNDNQMGEEIPERNYSATKANEFIHKTIDSRERSAEARNKDGYTPTRQISDLKHNGLEYKGQPSKQRGSESEYIRKSSLQKPRNGMHENKAGEPKSLDNEKNNEYKKPENINERRMSDLKSNDNEYKGQPIIQKVRENEYVRKSSLQKPKNGSKIEEPRSLDNENINEYNNGKNKYERRMSELSSNGLEYKGQPSEKRGSENEHIRKSSQQKPRNGSSAEEPRSLDNENINEYNNGKNKYERKMSELNSNGLEYRGQPNEKRGSENEYMRNLSQQNPRDGKNGSKIGEPRNSLNDNISEYRSEYTEKIPDRVMNELKRGGLDYTGQVYEMCNECNDYKGQASEHTCNENECTPRSSQQKPRNGINGNKIEEPRSSLNDNISEYKSEYTEKIPDRVMNELKRDDLDYIGQVYEMCNECNDYKGQPSEHTCNENECTPRSSQQKPRNGINGNNIEEPRSTYNKNISEYNSEYNDAQNKFDRRMSELKRDGLDHKSQLYEMCNECNDYNGQASEHRCNKNECTPKSSQQKPRNGMNGSKVEEPRSSLNENISEYNNEYNNAETKFGRRMSELKRNGLDHKRQTSEQRVSKMEYIPKPSQQKPRNGTNGNKIEEPRNSLNKYKSDYNNAENKFDQRMNDLRNNSIEYRGRLSNQRGRENETARKSSQQKTRDGLHGSRLSDPRSSLNDNISQQNKAEHKYDRKISELKNNGIGYKGPPSEQKGRENEHTRKLSQQKTRNGMNGNKVGEPRSSVNENTARINESRLKDPERNNRVSLQKIRESDLGSRFGENHSKGGDLRIRGGSGQDTERKGSLLKTADHRNKPITAGARTSIKEKTNPRPRLGVPPVQLDESETPLGDTDINDRLGEPNPILNDVDKRTFQPVRLDNTGGNTTIVTSPITETQQQARKSSLSTGKSSNNYPSVYKTITHWPQNPISNVPNQSEEKLVTKDNTDIPDFVSNELKKQYSVAKYPLQHITSPVTTPPMVEFGSKDTKKASTSIIKVISNQKSLAADSIPIENFIGDKEIIIISKNLLRNPETEIASMRLDSVKHVIDDIKDAPDQAKTGLFTIQRSVISIPVNEGVQTYAEVCDAAEQHGQGAIAYNTTKMQWAFSNLPSLQDSMVATNEKENVISILNKGDIVNLKLNIEVINGDRSVVSSQNTTQKSRSLTNIVTIEKGSQITIDDDLYEQSKSLQSLLDEETCKGSGFEGHPKVMVVQCACCDRLNNQPRSDLPACCESKKYIVLLPSSPQHLEDGCNCDNLRQSRASTVQCDAKRFSSGIPIKKTHSDMALETGATNKKDTGRLIAVINSTSQTEDTKSECLVTKHKVSITEDSLKCAFRKDSFSQLSMATHAPCTATCHATCNTPNTNCNKLYPQTSVQTDDSQQSSQPQLGSKISRGVLKQCPQICPQAGPQVVIVQNCPQTQNCPALQPQNCPALQSQNCPALQSQNCSQPAQTMCCPQTQSQSCPDTSQQVQTQGCPQRCPQTQNQTQQQEQVQEKCQTCPPVQDTTQNPSQTQMQSQESSQPKEGTNQSQGSQKVCPPTCLQKNPEVDEQLTSRVCMQVQSQAGQQDVSHTHSQTQWCCVMLEARLHEDGRYSFHLPPLDVLKHYSF
ncbi:unnamed protein product [Spodoptera littoralis]|uniref:Doublecortin domain-containing protein n=1 Tax=Spodoptera littoralis TaxID=7109 RepID=A0A9P0IDP0_SPOLI|nr:unnamed protein product [Spodoptera littoralis]CAH1643290.1 unnamed protein product [Spodoptera littoralis]